jgi:hypothetical protein
MTIDYDKTHVKARFPGERMWVKVISRREDEIIGKLDNDPAYDTCKKAIENGSEVPEWAYAVYNRGPLHDVKYNDVVVLERKDNDWYYKHKHGIQSV